MFRPVLGPMKRFVGLWFTFIILVQSRLINKTVWILFMFVLIYSPIGSIYYLIHYSNLISYHSENICHSGNFQYPSCTLVQFRKTSSESNERSEDCPILRESFEVVPTYGILLVKIYKEIRIYNRI